MKNMYEGKINSPVTVLTENINNETTTIEVDDISVFPEAPNIAVIGTDETAETILYETIDGNELQDVTRGFQGIAKSWDSGTSIARLFTEYDYNTLKENIETLDNERIENFLDLTDTPEDYTGNRGKVATVNSDEDALIFDTPQVLIGNVGDGVGLYKGLDADIQRFKTIKASEGIELGWTERIGSWDVSSMMYNNKNLVTLGQAITWSNDGTKFWDTHALSSYFYLNTYTCLTPWNVVGATSSSFKFIFSTWSPRQITWNNDGTVMYITRSSGTNKSIEQFPCSIPYDPTTAGASGGSKSFGTTTQYSVQWHPSGTRLFIVRSGNVVEYSVGVAWDVTEIVTTAVKTGPASSDIFYIDPTGKYLYTNDTGSYKIIQYELTTPWDVSSYSATGKDFYYYDETATGILYSINFSLDGLKMYIAKSKEVYQYDAITQDVWHNDNFYLTDTIELKLKELTNDLDNKKYSGQTTLGTVGENVSFGDLLYFDFSDKKYYKALGDDADTSEVTAIAVEDILEDKSGKVLKQGYIRNDDWTFNSNIVYLSVSDEGEMQSTVPVSGFIKRVGQAEDASVLYFNPSQDIGEVE